MKITVFGATRGTGLQVVEQALARGHAVTAFARNPAAVAISHARLEVVAGDAFDAAAVERAIAGRDAVVNSLGTRPWAHTDVCSAGTRNILRAMDAHGVKRLVTISSYGVGESRAHVSWLGRTLGVDLLLRRALADKEVMEREIRGSRADWVTVRPAFLTNGRASGRVRAAADGSIRGDLLFISRADVAAFALEQLSAQTFVRAAPTIAAECRFGGRP